MGKIIRKSLINSLVVAEQEQITKEGDGNGQLFVGILMLEPGFALTALTWV